MTVKRIPSADEFRLLVSFLGDPSEQTVRLVRNQLREALRAQPSLRSVLESWSQTDLKADVHQILEELRLEDLFDEWVTLAQQGSELDLERGSILLARLAYPQLEFSSITRILDQFAEAMDEILETSESPQQTQMLLGQYLFRDLGFRGNAQHYDDPDNTYINRVLDRRTGLPITLSCLYLFIGWRLNLPVYGVGLPGHFIAAHVIEGRAVYIDAFNGGRILTPADCAQLVRRRGVEFQERFLFPMSKDQIMSRMILNLITIYTEHGQVERAQWLGRVLAVIQNPTA